MVQKIYINQSTEIQKQFLTKLHTLVVLLQSHHEGICTANERETQSLTVLTNTERNHQSQCVKTHDITSSLHYKSLYISCKPKYSAYKHHYIDSISVTEYNV